MNNNEDITIAYPLLKGIMPKIQKMILRSSQVVSRTPPLVFSKKRVLNWIWNFIASQERFINLAQKTKKIIRPQASNINFLQT
jgi:hypothetical protein